MLPLYFNRMNIFCYLIIFLISNLYADAFNITIEEDDHSFVLTDTNWDHAHGLYEYLMVFFYKPDCDQCYISDEIFVFAAKHAKETGHEVKFAFVDASKEVDIVATEGIENIPSVRFYRNQTGIEYLHTMGKDRIMEWLKQRTNFVLKTVTNADEGLQVLKQNPLVVLACILSDKVSDVRDFEIVASLHDELEFRLIKDAEVCQQLGLPTSGTSLSIYQYEFNIQHQVWGELNRKLMNDFIVKHHVPLYSEFNQFIFTKSFFGHYHFFVPLIFKTLPITVNEIKSQIRSIAKELDEKVIFIHFDTSKSHVRVFLEHLSVPHDDGFRVVESNKHLINFKPESPLNLNGSYMLSFIKSVMDGLAEPELRTSDPPENWEKMQVKPLVRKTYDQVTLDTTKDVFVIIFAPDCKFSMEALKLFDKLGEIYKDNPNIVIASFDSSLNELPRLRVQSTPQFYLYLKDTNEAIKFVGERTVEVINKFLASKGKEWNEPQLLDASHLQHAKLTEHGLEHDEL